MNKGELMDLLVRAAKEYAPHAEESIRRNRHMNGLGPHAFLPPAVLDAAVVDFVNFVGMRQGLDLALYTKDLR